MVERSDGAAMTSENERVWIFIVFVCIATSTISNFAFGSNIGKVSCKYHLSYSPSSEAFSVWILIYSTALLSVAAQLFKIKNSEIGYLSNILFASAWLAAAVWTPTFVQDEIWSHIVAALILVLCAGCALGAVLVMPEFAETLWLNRFAFSIFAGWTLTASILSLGIAYSAIRSNGTECDSDQKNDGEISVIPMILAFVVSVLSIITNDPFLPLAPTWGIIFMQPNHLNWIGIASLSVSFIISLLRVLV